VLRTNPESGAMSAPAQADVGGARHGFWSSAFTPTYRAPAAESDQPAAADTASAAEQDSQATASAKARELGRSKSTQVIYAAVGGRRVAVGLTAPVSAAYQSLQQPAAAPVQAIFWCA
jgi:hypothetical protein